MTYAAAEGREELLGFLGRAIGELDYAVAALGEAYELLDETSGDRLEEAIFKPVQQALGAAKRASSSFAARTGSSEQPVGSDPPAHPSVGARQFIDDAMDAVGQAEAALAEAQDSPLLVDVGDQELRAALADVRTRLDGVTRSAREYVRTLGR